MFGKCSYLPRYSSEHQQQAIVHVEPVVLRVDVAYPVHVHGAERLHVLVGPREGDAHPQADEDAEQLDDVGIRHGVQPSEQRVEDGHASAEDDRRFLVHVDDYSQSCTCTDVLM